MAGVQKQTKAGLGAAMALAALPVGAGEAGASYLHARLEVRQQIGATATFLEQAGKKHDTHVFLYRCSDLGLTADTPRNRATMEQAREEFKSAFPEISLFLSDTVKPGESISDLTRLMDNLSSGHSCPKSYELALLTVEPNEKAIFISVPENFAEENFHAFSNLPAEAYRADLPSLLPDSIDWMLRHEFNHYVWDLKAKACRAETTGACALEDEAQADKMTAAQSTPAQKQRIFDTRAIGAMQGSDPDHNTSPFISGTAGRKYDQYFAASYESINAMHDLIRKNLLDGEGNPVITADMPETLKKVMENCVATYNTEMEELRQWIPGQALSFTKDKRLPTCLVEHEPRMVPALAARIDPRDLSPAAQTYLIDYFRALGREARVEFYENEVTDYVRRSGFNPSP